MSYVFGVYMIMNIVLSLIVFISWNTSVSENNRAYNDTLRLVNSVLFLVFGTALVVIGLVKSIIRRSKGI